MKPESREQHKDKCSAPLCMYRDSVEDSVVWTTDDPICSHKPHNDLQELQMDLVDRVKEGLCESYTVKMLKDKCK